MQPSRPNNPTRLLVPAVVLAIVLFLALNVMVSNLLRPARVDLTGNHLFTLSEGTRSVVSGIDEPLHFRLFMSEDLIRKLPQLAAYAARVREMLDAYATLSRGRIRVETIDPKPYSDAEDRAVGLGVNRFSVGESSESLFFGLAATNSTDGKAVIPAFSPDREPFLEYDLTRLVAELGNRGKPVVAVFDGIGLNPNPFSGEPLQQLMVQLKQFFEVRYFQREADALPEHTRVVLLAHPQRLSDATLFAIDQWVLGGGATLVFVDPHAETQRGPSRGAPVRDASSTLEKLFDAWGIGFDRKRAVADPVYALRGRRQVAGRETDVANYPWLGLRGEALDRHDATVAELSSILMTTAGGFTINNPDARLRPLITASAKAGLIDAAMAADRNSDPGEILATMKRPGSPPVLAARVEGRLVTAFPGGAPKGAKSRGRP
ncbi:MAG: GldG family protein [Burkholderiaceae bacterium]